MQDRYVGDIGDYANNGLLRYLSGVTDVSLDVRSCLGIIWYRTKPSDSQLRESIGNRIDYLNSSDSNDWVYRKCDPPLYDALQTMVGESLKYRTRRTISQIENRQILPNDTLHFKEYMPDTQEGRELWLKRAQQKTTGARLVFVNPDIGIDLNENTISPAHISIGEIRKLYKPNKILIIYQHFNRNQGTVPHQIQHTSRHLERELDPMPLLWALQWNRAPIRFYFIVGHPDNDETLEILNTRINDLRNVPWGQSRPRRPKNPHFSQAYPQGTP